MLTARQEDDARHSGRHMPPQATQRRVGDLLHGRLVSTVLAGDDHVGLEQYSLQFNALLKESIKHGVKNNTRDALTAVYRMRSAAVLVVAAFLPETKERLSSQT